MSERQQRLISCEFCWYAGNILPANSAVEIRKARGSQIFVNPSFHICLVAALTSFANCWFFFSLSLLSYSIVIISLTERSLKTICFIVIFYSAAHFSCLTLRESFVEKKIWFRFKYLCKTQTHQYPSVSIAETQKMTDV